MIWKIKIVLLLSLLIFLPAVTLTASPFAREDSHFINPQYSKKISMDFKNAPLSEVLKIFSKQAGMNFVAKTDINSMRVTLYLAEVPLEEALEYVLSANDLQYTAVAADNTFIVSKRDQGRLVTRVFNLKHATVTTSALKGTFSISDSSSSSSGGGFGAQSSQSSMGGLVDAVKMVLTKSGSMVEDSRTNSLVITDLESQMPVIEETIKKLDVVVAQILIDVDMLDISKTTSDLMGAKWGENIFSFQGSSKASVAPFDQSSALSQSKVDLNIDGDTASPYTAGKLDFSQMTVVLNFLRTRTDTKSLARPRILTLNNQTAQIQVSTNEAIGVTTSNFASSSTTSSVSAEREKTGVFLTVTPQADLETREILMAVNPKVIQVRNGITVSGTTFKDPEERGTKSYLRVKDGQTIILGGLIRNDDSNTITKVPFLGDIPFLGAPFRHKNSTATKRELVIFLTPHILDDQSSGMHQFKKLNPQYNWDEVNKMIDQIENEK